MAAAGKVLTGFSKPYVALYGESGGVVSYSSGQVLARGVSVSVSPEGAEDANNFYADNVLAESVQGGRFTGGTVTLTVDGLLAPAEKLVYGLPTASSLTVGTESVSVYKYDDDADYPYCGVGWVTRYMSDGTEYFVGTVLKKVAFQPKGDEAATQEEDIDWQTQELTATIMRDDSAKHEWKEFTADLATELAAENAVRVMLGLAVLS